MKGSLHCETAISYFCSAATILSALNWWTELKQDLTLMQWSPFPDFYFQLSKVKYSSFMGFGMEIYLRLGSLNLPLFGMKMYWFKPLQSSQIKSGFKSYPEKQRSSTNKPIIPAVEVSRPPRPLEHAVPPELPRHRPQAQRPEELVGLLEHGLLAPLMLLHRGRYVCCLEVD